MKLQKHHIVKVLHKINAWSFGITLALYLFGYIGMIAQFFLGMIQLTTAIALTVHWKRLLPQPKKWLLVYWSIVALYSIVPIINSDIYGQYWLFFFVILPLAIAGYFTFVTYTIAISDEENLADKEADPLDVIKD